MNEDIVGSIRINSKSYTDAFINDPDGGPDIYIEGSQSRNVAMDGDIVKVRLHHRSKWKLNHNTIADRWDDWSQYLVPIIEKIEDAEKKNGAKLPANLPLGISKLQVDHVTSLPFYNQCIQKTGVVVEIVKKNHSGVAGGFLRPHSPTHALFSPTDSRVPRMLIGIEECPLDLLSQPNRYKNVLFVAHMIDWKGIGNFAKGSLVRIVGDCHNIQSRIETVLLENQIYDEDFPQDAYEELEYLKNLPNDWFSVNSKGRRDLTNECIFSIDPKTARDLDDAVSIKQVAEQIYEVGVHIADVSYFVKEMSAVDYYARLRTTSVYLVDRVIPMLPRILCEHMCSLNPGEPKFTFSVIWKMDRYGRIIDQWFGKTIIKSCAKLAYEQAQDMIDKPDDISWIEEGANMPKLHAYTWKHISKSVVMLNKIAQNMRAKRFEDGALRIEKVKLKFELDRESGFPTGFSMENRSSANFLIEEFMLLANMCVARKIYQYSKENAFLRRHPSCDTRLMKEVKEFCEAKGCHLDVSSSGSIQKSLNSITDPSMYKVVSFLLLRAMKNAEYICTGSLGERDDNFRHYALNVPFYTHFTSPIRRYADIIVHRLLALSLGVESVSNEDVHSLSRMADECTKRKISSRLVSETSQKLYFNLFVQRAGFCELLACVTRIQDKSLDIVLVDYDISGRVYLDRLKPNHLSGFKFESFSGVRRLVLQWKPSDKNSNSKKANKKHKKKNGDSLVQIDTRSNLEATKTFNMGNDSIINEAKDDEQVIEIFDIIKVIITADEKDITQLKFDLKTPG